MVKDQKFSLKIRNKTRMPTFIAAVQHCASNPGQNCSLRERKKRKRKTIFADDMILRIENSEESTRNLLELVNLAKL